jgi:hypothetical protein
VGLRTVTAFTMDMNGESIGLGRNDAVGDNDLTDPVVVCDMAIKDS